MSMRMNNLFNSAFETSLRVVSLMGIYNEPCTKDRIFYLDFITCYASAFGYPMENLHGDNKYMFGELSNRRALLQEAIKALVTTGAIAAKIVNKEYVFSITAAGRQYVDSFESDYAKQYVKIARVVADSYRNVSDQDLMDIIQDKALTSAKGGN